MEERCKKVWMKRHKTRYMKLRNKEIEENPKLHATGKVV